MLSFNYDMITHVAVCTVTNTATYRSGAEDYAIHCSYQTTHIVRAGYEREKECVRERGKGSGVMLEWCQRCKVVY